jgi:hypothetical protein
MKNVGNKQAEPCQDYLNYFLTLNKTRWLGDDIK